jgi:hypothetical protein
VGRDGNLWFTELFGNNVTRARPALLGLKCVVPRLAGKSLAQARRLLLGAHCALGKVTQPARHTRTPVVVSQKPAARKTLPLGATVSLRLR